MRSHVTPRSTGLLALAAVAVLWGGFSGAAPSAEAAGHDLTGQRAPEISVPVGLHGLPTGATLQSFRGKVVVLKFFFIGCPTCRASLPGFQDLYTRYAPRGVQFVGLAYDDRATVESYVNSHGFTFPLAIDAAGTTPLRYGVRTYPTDYVIGGDGTVLSYDRLSAGVLEQALATTRARANVEELGPLPAALAGVAAAARDNDYGQVLRLVEAHLDVAKDGAEVAAAAARVQAIAKTRFERRIARVRARFDGGDRAGALQDAHAVVLDFHDTSASAAAADFEKDLQHRAAGARVAAR